MNGTAALGSVRPASPPAVRAPRLYRAVVRGALAVHAWLVALAARRPRRPFPADGSRILLTGTFHSDNWIRAHLAPLAASGACREIVMVGSSRGPSIPKVRWIVAPAALRRIAGDVPARLLSFAWIALRTRPEVVGGFHLLINGLVALLAGRAAGARTWYFCVGGPAEFEDGGIHGENPYFLRLRVADPIVERRLLDAAGGFDTVVAMGSRARTFLRARGALNPCEVIAGGVDPPPGGDAMPVEFDAILVARLVPIKRIDVFLEAIGRAAQLRTAVRAAIVGDGPLREALTARTRELGLEGCITFAGQQSDVTAWLRRSRVFMLTSASEGLALSLMEAMACGLPAIVPDVGDLRDLVEHDHNGIVVTDRRPAVFGEELAALLNEPARMEQMSRAARSASTRYTSHAATAQWDRVLAAPVRSRPA